jgi:hypothetical protein
MEKLIAAVCLVAIAGLVGRWLAVGALEWWQNRRRRGGQG